MRHAGTAMTGLRLVVFGLLLVLGTQVSAEQQTSALPDSPKPRKQFIGSRAAEPRFAEYLNAWLSRIESVGTRNFPADNGKSRYGSLIVSVEIRHDGSIIRSDIQRSSGNRSLDEHALNVLQMAAPFAPFSADIRKDTDVLVITRTWNFLNEKGASLAVPKETP